MVLITDFVFKIVKHFIVKSKIIQLIDVLLWINVQQNLICMLIGMQEHVFFLVVLATSQIIELKPVFLHVHPNGNILEAN